MQYSQEPDVYGHTSLICTVICVRNSKQYLENFRESILKGDVFLQKIFAFTCVKIFQQNIISFMKKHMRKF